MRGDLKAQGEHFLGEFVKADATERSSLRLKGQKLAREIRSAGIDLCHNRATEFSPDIQVLFLLAAKIAYLSFGAGTREVEPFEQDVYYYANFTPPDPIVASYDAFKRMAS